MKIPFLNRKKDIEKRGIDIVDSKTHSLISFDTWTNRFSSSKRTPILENIYGTIASEFSKIDLLLIKDNPKKGDDKEVYVQMKDNPNFDVFALRPNMLQTKSELLYTVAYQMHMYGNALVKIIRAEGTDRNIIKALEPINVDDYLFGQGYEVGDSLYLKLKEKKSGKIILLDYSDLIHLRLNPNDIFYGDRNDSFDLTSFVKLFDENLNVLMNELKESGKVKGVIEVGGSLPGSSFNAVLGSTESKTNKQDEIIKRIKDTKGGVLVLDSGEKWTNLSSMFETMSTEEVNNFMKYLYNFKGINQVVIDGTATEAQMEVFFNKTIMPIVERFLEEMNYKCLTPTARTQGQKIEYFKNPFEYMAMKDAISNLYLGAMYFTQNEGRRLAFKLPPIPGGDVLLDNKNFTKEFNALKKTKGGDDDTNGKDS